MAQNIRQRNASNQIIQERFKELKKRIEEQDSRIQNLQTSAFQLANYYFVFQGVVLAAISNSTSLTCSDSWFIFTLSLLAALLNLFALFSIAIKYVRTMDLYDQTWSELNSTRRMLSPTHQSGGGLSPGNNYDHSQDEQWTDHFSQRRRYVVLAVRVVLFLAFTGVTLSGPWLVICKHDKHTKHPFGEKDCLKLCDGSRCMIFCRDT